MEDRLRKFTRLVDAGSFTKAASLLHISQPALTTAIKKLERELKAELIDRNGHGFTITPAGQAAYQAAKEMDVQTRNLRLRLDELANEKTPLNLGMIDSIADLLFVHEDNLPMLEEGTHLSLAVDNSSRLIQYVERGDLDMAFVARPAVLPKGVSSGYLGDEPLVTVTSAAYLAQTQAHIQKGELRNFLSYDQNSQTYRLVRQYFSANGIAVYPTFYSTSPEIMLQLVLTHRTIAVLPYLLVKPHLDQKVLAQVNVGGSSIIARSIIRVHRTGRRLPAQATVMAERAQKRLAMLNEAALMQT